MVRKNCAEQINVAVCFNDIALTFMHMTLENANLILMQVMLPVGTGWMDGWMKST